MKILLLNPPAKKLYLRDYYCSTSTKADYYWPPTDLLVLSGLLKNDHELSLLDANAMKMSFHEAKRRILKLKPDVIIFVTSTPTVKNDMSFLNDIKKEIKTKIYASGNYVYFRYQEAMEKYPELDGIIMDFTSKGIVNFFNNDKENANDIVFRDNEKIRITKRSNEKTFEIPVPKHELLILNNYHLPQAKRHPLTCMLTTIGCPFDCAFCHSGNLVLKQRPVKNTIEELKHVQSLGIKEVFFRDYTFTMNKEITKELCKEMIKNKIDISWICSTRADVVDKELLFLMKKAGCHTIQFGVESGSDRILEKYSKRINKKQLKEIFEVCDKLKINTLAHFIIGLPGETREDIEETIKFSNEIKCDYAAFNLFVPILGCRSRDDVIKNGWLKEEDLSLLDSSDSGLPVETPWITSKELIELRKRALKKFYFRPKYMLRILSKKKSPKELKELIKNGYAVLMNVVRK